MLDDHRGWVKAWRKMDQSELWSICPNHFKVAWGCLLKANREPKEWYDRIGKNNILVPAGQFITSLNYLADYCQVSKRVLRNALATLSKIDFLGIDTGTGQFTRIILKNWHLYQDHKPKEAQVGAQGEAQVGHSRGTGGAPTKEVLEVKEFIEVKKEDNTCAPPERVPDPEPKEKANPNFQPFKLHFCERYQKIKIKKYAFQGVKDAEAIKRLVGSLELDDLKNRLEEFFEDRLEWMTGNPDHTIAIFWTQINKYGKRGQYDFRNKGVEVDPKFAGKSVEEIKAMMREP